MSNSFCERQFQCSAVGGSCSNCYSILSALDGALMQAIGVAILISWSMLYSEVILIQRHNPPANQCLISRVNFQPRKRLVVNTQGELTSTEIPVVFQYSAQASYFAAFRGIRDTKIEKSRGIQDKLSL